MPGESAYPEIHAYTLSYETCVLCYLKRVTFHSPLEAGILFELGWE